MVTAGFTWQKTLFQIVTSASILLLLRLVVYPRLVQRQWNWRHAFDQARRTFSRLSRAAEVEAGANEALASAASVMTLQTVTWSTAGVGPTVRLDVWNVGSSHGSWTFLAAGFPFLWAVVMYVAKKLVRHSVLEKTLFPEDHDGASMTSLRQLDVQRALYTSVMALSCLKLLITLDWVLQDRHYSRALFSNWLHTLRRVYTEFPVVRLLWCWISLAGLLVGGIYFGGFEELQNQWLTWQLQQPDEKSSVGLWFSNASWRVLLSSLVVALDFLWLIQDWGFPCFASPLGIKLFGFHLDQFTVRLSCRLRLCFTNKWLGGFLVAALLLPLEICQFLQIAAYSPSKYAQSVDPTTFHVLPLNASSVDEEDTANLDAVTILLLRYGSPSLYFPWSAWDRVPAFTTLFLAVTALIWLWRAERCKMCFAVYLGEPTTQEERVKRVASLNASLPSKTKCLLNKQRRLRALYKLRARSDSFCIALAALSVLIVWLQFRAIWRSRAKDDHSLPLQSPGETHAALLLLITLVLLYQVHHRYRLKMEIMALRNEIPPECRFALWRSPRLLLLPFLIELLLCGLFLPPLVHGRVYLQEKRYALPKMSLAVVPACPSPLTMTSTNRTCELQYSYPLEIVNMVVLVRLYWFARVVRNQLLKQIVSEKSFVASGTLLTSSHVPVDSLWWSFCVYFALRPAQFLLTLFLVLWVGTAAAVSIFERPFPSKLDGEDHSLWLTLVTMTTVGYGDAYPITANGRVAIVLGAVLGGLAFVSLMTSEFLESLKGSKREHTVVATLDNMQWERSVRSLGAALICAAWKRHHHYRLGQERSNGMASSSTRRGGRRFDKQLVSAAHHFKVCRKRKPKQSTQSLHNLQTSALSEWHSHELNRWMTATRAETLSNIEALEHQMGILESSVQALL
ncbi:hypothetical protein BBJ28_00024634 [Nothophytophthora sp. Chile5]|nr:hypothetical protein BBJ28_00024634 [Nothophytophthora sp. Chile5]